MVKGLDFKEAAPIQRERLLTVRENSRREAGSGSLEPPLAITIEEISRGEIPGTVERKESFRSKEGRNSNVERWEAFAAESHRHYTGSCSLLLSIGGWKNVEEPCGLLFRN